MHEFLDLQYVALLNSDFPLPCPHKKSWSWVSQFGQSKLCMQISMQAVEENPHITPSSTVKKMFVGSCAVSTSTNTHPIKVAYS